MRSSRTVLALTTLFALTVFVFNALPSTVILDDSDSQIVPAAQHRSVGTAPDITIPASFALVLVFLLGSALYTVVPKSTVTVPPNSIARAPPAYAR